MLDGFIPNTQPRINHLILIAFFFFFYQLLVTKMPSNKRQAKNIQILAN